MVTIHLTPTNYLAIELQHISKKYPILSVFYRYQKRFKYHILAHMLQFTEENDIPGLLLLIDFEKHLILYLGTFFYLY